MKFFTTLIFIIFYSMLFGQDNSQLSRDTAQANRLYQEAMNTLGATSESGLKALEEAKELYEKHPFLIDGVLIRYEYIYSYKYQQGGINYAVYDSLFHELVTDVTSNGYSKYHPSLLEVYYELIWTNIFMGKSEKALFYAEEMEKSVGEGKRKDERKIYALASKASLHSEWRISVDQAYLALKEAREIIETTQQKISDGCYLEYYEALNAYYKYTREIEKRNIFLQKKIQFAKNAPFTTFYGYLDLASNYGSIQSKDKEKKYYQLAFDALENIKSDTSLVLSEIDFAHLNFNTANSFFTSKNYEKAIFYYDATIEILENNDKTNFWMYASTIGYKGTSYYHIEKYEESLSYLKKSIALDSTNAFVFTTLGRVFNKLEQYDEALKYLQHSLSLVMPEIQPEDVFYNPTLNFEESISQTGELKEIFYQKSKAFLKKALLKDSLDAELLNIAQETGELALKFLQAKDLKTFRYLETSTLIVNNRRALIIKNLIESTYHLHQQTPNSKHLASLFRYFETYKAQNEIAAQYRKKLSEEDLEKELDYISQVGNLQQQLDFANETSFDEYQSTLFKVSDEYEYFRRQLKKSYPVDFQNSKDDFLMSIEEAQASLGAKEAIISYALPEDKYLYISLLTKNNYQVKKVNIPFNMNENIESVANFMKDPFNRQRKKREAFIDQSHQLHQLLIAPILEDLTETTHLLIIPDNELHNLPFEALVKSNEKVGFHELDYLIKDFSISYHYSGIKYLKDKRAKTPEVSDGSLLAFAPIFDDNQVVAANRMRSLNLHQDSTYRSFNGNQFSHLPNTENEVKSIASILHSNEKTKILLQAEATKTNLYAQIEQPYQFIHFATHGLVNNKNNKYSSLVGYSKDANSLDRFLFMNEIKSKKINADLVVLSSCESGVGNLWNNEGMIALNRTFMYAGANNVLFTLWKIRDLHSSNLMIDFYKNYLTQKNYAAALRQAKLNFLKDPNTANPSFWAAFMLIGG